MSLEESPMSTCLSISPSPHPWFLKEWLHRMTQVNLSVTAHEGLNDVIQFFNLLKINKDVFDVRGEVKETVVWCSDIRLTLSWGGGVNESHFLWNKGRAETLNSSAVMLVADILWLKLKSWLVHIKGISRHPSHQIPISHCGTWFEFPFVHSPALFVVL